MLIFISSLFISVERRLNYAFCFSARLSALVRLIMLLGLQNMLAPSIWYNLTRIA